MISALVWFRITSIDCKYFAGKPVASTNFGLCLAAKENFYWHFLATTFFHLATEKKNSVASWRLTKKVNFGPWKLVNLWQKKLRNYCHILRRTCRSLLKLGINFISLWGSALTNVGYNFNQVTISVFTKSRWNIHSCSSR